MDKNDIKQRLSDCSISQLKSTIGLFGNFSMSVFSTVNGKKKRIRRVIKKNQITNSGRSAILNLLYTGSPGTEQETYRIWSIAVGINNTPPAISDDVGSMTPIWYSAFSPGVESVMVESPPNAYYLQLNKVLPDSDATGYTLTEAGIFTRGNDEDPPTSTTKLLYARQIYPSIIKTSTMSIEFDWQLGITIQGT